MMRPHIHPHVRKREYDRRLEPVPARTYGLRLLDLMVYAAGILAPVMTLPQMFKIFLYHDAAGVSALTWGAYALFDLPWILYGLAHRERPITITYLLWFLCNGAVFVGTLIYGTGLW